MEEDQICSYCGNPGARTHSGRLECGRCWNWRKLESPAARYWSKAITRLFSDGEGSSGPDYNDYMMWERWGMRDSVVKALYTLSALEQAYEEMLENPRPWSVKED